MQKHIEILYIITRFYAKFLLFDELCMGLFFV